MEFLAEMVIELFLQLIVEGLAEVGVHLVANRFERPINPVLATIGYAALGGVMGAATLWLFPHSFIEDPTLKVINLIATPILVGLAMTGIGRWRQARAQPLVRLDRFGYAVVFALALGIVRYLGAR